VDQEIVHRFDGALLRRVRAVPLYGSQEEIAVAMADPTDAEAVAELGGSTGSTLSLVIGCPASIRRALDYAFGPERGSLEPTGHGAADPASPGAARGDDSGDGASEASGERHVDVVWDRAGLNFLLYQLHAAREKRASEIHFLPAPEGIAVYYRTDQGLELQAIERPETSRYLRGRLAHLGAPDLGPEDALVAGGAIALEVRGERVQVGVCHCRAGADVTTVLRMSPAVAEAPDLADLGLPPIAEAEIRDFVDGPEGLVVVHGPPRSGGTTVLASLAALAARPHRRTLVLEPTRVAPYAAGATRVTVAGSASAPGLWQRLTVGLGADVVVLDGILCGDAIVEVLGGATIGRLVFARTDWLDGRRLLAHLVRSRDGGAVLRDRPFAMIALPAVRREGSGVWITPEEAERQAGLLTSTILADEDRDALFAGAEG
jgi:hypothetical protein